MDKNRFKKISLNIAREFLLSILAGISISIGCIAFLTSESKIVGALFFVVGLFIILNFNFSLFTGKICYCFDNKPKYILTLLCDWIGNVAGTLIVALMTRATRLININETALNIVNIKLNDSLLSLFFLAIFCNILIFVAVYGYKNFENILAKMVALFFGVSVFVLCGFEHCIADAFYFAFAGVYTLRALLCLVIITLGNIVGGLSFSLFIKILNKNKVK